MPETNDEINRLAHRELLHIVVIFLAAQFAGLFLATQLFYGASFQEVQAAQTGAALQGGLEYALYFIALVIGFSLILILITKLYKGSKILYIIESVVIFSASFFVFAILLGSLFSLFNVADTPTAETALLIATVVLSVGIIALKNLVPRTRNYVTILIAAGVGAIWGYNFSFSTVYLIFAVFAIYDVIAVFVTKHMVTMAKAMVNKNLTFMVQVGDIKAVPEREMKSGGGAAGYVRETDRAAKGDALYREVRQSRMVPIPVGNALGTGDIIMPMALAVAAYKVQLNFVLGFFVIFGALLGFVMVFFILGRMRRMLPALPPLLFGCSIGVALYYALYIAL